MKIVSTFNLLVFVLFVTCNRPPVGEDYDWKDCSVGEPVALESISMIDENVGYIGGIPPLDTVSRINYIDDYTMQLHERPELVLDKTDYKPYWFYAETSFHSLFKTTDGGMTWEGIKTPFAGGIKHLNFLSESIGFVVTEEQGVFKTRNGGISWEQILTNDFHLYRGTDVWNCIDKVAFADGRHGFAFDVTDDLVLKTMDGGENWECVNLRYPANIAAVEPTIFDRRIEVIHYVSSDTVFVSCNGSNGLYISMDGGNAWESIANDAAGYGKTLFKDGRIFLPAKGLISSDKGENWQNTSSYTSMDNGCLVNNEEVYYSNWDGIMHAKIYEFGYGEPMTMEISTPIKDMAFPSANLGIAIGNNGVVLRFSK